jgi:phage shock protein E
MKLKEILKNKKGSVIDVRNPDELSEGTFPDAVNIPVNEILFRVEEVKNMQGPLVLYCQSGKRSSMAMLMLRSAGINSEIHNGGGYLDMLTFLN